MLAAIAAAIFAWRAAEETKRGANAAEDGLRSEYRCWLDIKITTDWAIVYPDKVIVAADVELKNVGRSPGLNVVYGSDYMVVPHIHTDAHAGDYAKSISVKYAMPPVLTQSNHIKQIIWVIPWGMGEDEIDPRKGMSPLLGIAVEYDVMGALRGKTTRWFWLNNVHEGTSVPIVVHIDDDGLPTTSYLNHLLCVPAAYASVC